MLLLLLLSLLPPPCAVGTTEEGEEEARMLSRFAMTMMKEVPIAAARKRKCRSRLQMSSVCERILCYAEPKEEEVKEEEQQGMQIVGKMLIW